MINFSRIMSKKEHLTFILQGKLSLDVPLLKLLYPYFNNFNDVMVVVDKEKFSVYELLFPRLKKCNSLEKLDNGVIISNTKTEYFNNNLIISNDKHSNFISENDLSQAILNLISFFSLKPFNKFEVPSLKYLGNSEIILLKNFLVRAILKRKKIAFYESNKFGKEFIENFLSKNHTIYSDDEEIIYFCNLLKLRVEKFSLLNILRGNK